MYYDIECPKPAYDRFVRERIVNRIFDRKKTISELFLYKTPYNDKNCDRVKKAAEQGLPVKLPFSISINERTEIFKDILTFYTEFDDFEYGPNHQEFEDLILNHPGFLAYLLLGEDVLKFRDFRFPTRKSLEQAVMSFCMGEERSFSEGILSRDYYWRRQNSKFCIAQNEHGDLYASETDVSGREWSEKTLFGNEEGFDTMKLEPKTGAVCAYQDWSEFLMASLKYAQLIGMHKMPEIVNWRGALDSVGGGVGTNTAEALGGLSSDFSLKLLSNSPLFVQGEELKEIPLSIYYGDSDGRYIFMPCLIGKNLVYFREDKGGYVSFSGKFFEKRKFKKQVEYTPDDLPHVLKATYRFFARDRTLLPKIMEGFLLETQ